MSWLSSLFSSNDHTADVNAANAARDRAAAVARQQQADQATEDARLAEVRRIQAGQTASSGARSFFGERGLNPDLYQSDIDQMINSTLSTVNPNDPSPGQYLQNIGQLIYENKRNAGRDTAVRGVNQAFTPGFERSRIADTADDPFIAEAQAGQRGKAEDYINNLFKRGVITATGKTGAENKLAEQDPRVRTQLDELGQNVISSGRQSLTDVANRARGDASMLDLGGTFDPSKYTTEADTNYNDFLAKFGDRFKSSVPDNLYDTAGLSTAAGVSQGAQNTAFDPNALAGLLSTEQKPKEEDPTNPTKKPRSLF